MDRITVGLDFGTHQTKICVENRADVNNPIYKFYPFKDLEGKSTVIIPSIVQINNDDTLSYGFVDKSIAKYGKKYYIGERPKYPQIPQKDKSDDIPAPICPKILTATPPSAPSDLKQFSISYDIAKKSYDTQVSLWKQRLNAQKVKNERIQKELNDAYQRDLKEWYRWQNIAQTNHRLVYRYFKQNLFSYYKWDCIMSSTHLSIWYLAYIIFKLEEQYGQNFAIQMGIPTGSDNFEAKKTKAVSILLSAYNLVEDVFKNNLSKFLAAKVYELEKVTTIIPYSEEKKFEYGILIFPEAYAALKSLTAKGKIEQGMSIMVDIGGGTTDTTFFTIMDGRPKIYDYSSIPYGLNYIIENALPDVSDRFDNLATLDDIEKGKLEAAVNMYYNNLSNTCNMLLQRIHKNFESKGYHKSRLYDALRDRPLIYSGGGSTYGIVRKHLYPFTDIKLMNPKIWEGMTIDKISSISKLCPIISTALGLAIQEDNDKILLHKPEDLFSHMENYVEETKPRPRWV